MNDEIAANRQSVSRPGKARLRRRAVVVAAGVGCIALDACGTDQISAVQTSNDWNPGTTAHDISVAGVTRSFLLHVPPRSASNSFRPGVGTGSPLPLVVVLHGSSGDGEAIRSSSQMDSLADARGFLVAYPNGSDGGFGLYPSDWNAGTCCGAPFREGVDDLAFVAAVIARVEAQLSVDQARVFIAGFSDGGRMAYHVACQLGPKIAAIAVVSGSLTDDQCYPGVGVPLLAIHGTADDQVPYDDDSATPAPGRVPEMAADLPPSVQFWVAANGCANGDIARVSEHADRATFDPCSRGEVVVYSIDGGSHGWPGEPGSEGPMAELRASELIIDFFAGHGRR